MMYLKEGISQTIDKEVILCIYGMASSGKSKVAKRLAEKYRLRYYSGGDALKALASEMGYKVDQQGWWKTWRDKISSAENGNSRV